MIFFRLEEKLDTLLSREEIAAAAAGIESALTSAMDTLHAAISPKTLQHLRKIESFSEVARRCTETTESPSAAAAAAAAVNGAPPAEVLPLGSAERHLKTFWIAAAATVAGFSSREKGF